jgi:hypothetical protein
MNGQQQPSNMPANLTQRLDINFALQAGGLGVLELDPVTKKLSGMTDAVSYLAWLKATRSPMWKLCSLFTLTIRPAWTRRFNRCCRVSRTGNKITPSERCELMMAYYGGFVSWVGLSLPHPGRSTALRAWPRRSQSRYWPASNWKTAKPVFAP